MKKEDIKELLNLFSDIENINKMKLKYEELELELEKNPTPTNPAPVIQAPAIMQELTPIQEDKPAVSSQSSAQPCITSPMVGTFYKAPAPGATPFAKIGDMISKGQTVAIVEAMKIMNEIEAEYDCKIVKVLVEDGQPVEFDMPLYEVEKL